MLPQALRGRGLGLGTSLSLRLFSTAPAEFHPSSLLWCVSHSESPLSICFGTLTEWGQNILWDSGLPDSHLPLPRPEAEGR